MTRAIVEQLSVLGDAPTLSDEAIAVDYLQSTQGIGTPTICSLSGGKSSAYMAVHYPADYYVFAVVLSEDPRCRVQDKGLLRAIREKCPEFEGSKELDRTLRNVLELEQLIGQEISWVWGPTFEQLIEERSYLPNHRARFCTEEMKLLPIYRWVTETFGEKSLVEMNIGYRYDEPRRVYKLLGAETLPGGGLNWDRIGSCEKLPKSQKKREWRFKQFPMFLDRVVNPQVIRFWERKGWEFPEISNCDFCFHHKPSEMRRQAELYPERAQPWIEQEETRGNQFGKAPLREIIEGKATPLFDGEFSCNCTD